MKIFISADIEGIAGVMQPAQCTPGSAEHQLARALMEGEVNAAIEGAFDGGASEVVVADSHGAMTNLRPDHIDPRARLVQGKPRLLSMVEGLEQQAYDGLMFIGYHSAAGEHGVLAHTINGRAFHQVRINDEIMSESDIYAAAGAEHGVPLWLVSGDDTLQRWIGEHYPHTHYACVKRSISNTATESLSPQQACNLIRSAAQQAVKNASPEIATRIQPPYRLELRVTRPVLADLFCLIPDVERLDAVTVGYNATRMATLTGLLGAFSYLASTQF